VEQICIIRISQDINYSDTFLEMPFPMLRLFIILKACFLDFLLYREANKQLVTAIQEEHVYKIVNNCNHSIPAGNGLYGKFSKVLYVLPMVLTDKL
jgi:hypothetical protein